jgi:hypothetical protein
VYIRRLLYYEREKRSPYFQDRTSDFTFPLSSESLALLERSIPRPFGGGGGEVTPSVRATLGGDRDCDGAAFVEWEPTGEELLASL